MQTRRAASDAGGASPLAARSPLRRRTQTRPHIDPTVRQRVTYVPRALEPRRGDARLLNNLALAQRISGQAQQARATLGQAHRADPQLPAPLYNLALLRFDSLRDDGDLAEIRNLLAQFKQLCGPISASQPDLADALLADAEALLAWRIPGNR